MSVWIIPARQSRPQQLPLQFVTMHSHTRLSACDRWAEGRGGRVGGGSAGEGEWGGSGVSLLLYLSVSMTELAIW